MRIKNHIMALTVAMTAMSSCSSDEPANERIPSDAVYNFVTLDATSTKGSVLSMRKSDDSPLITYRCQFDFDRTKLIDAGDRLIICYSRTDGPVYSSGDIDLYGYINMANTKQKFQLVAPDADGQWLSQPLKVMALWRTGQYINLDAMLMVFQARKPQSFILAADPATIDDSVPQLHLMYTNAEDNDGHNPYEVYASFDIDSIWQLPTCTGIDILWHSPDGPSHQTFYKQPHGTIAP